MDNQGYCWFLHSFTKRSEQTLPTNDISPFFLLISQCARIWNLGRMCKAKAMIWVRSSALMQQQRQKGRFRIWIPGHEAGDAKDGGVSAALPVVGSTHIEILVFGKNFNPLVSPLCIKHCRSRKKLFTRWWGSRLIEHRKGHMQQTIWNPDVFLRTVPSRGGIQSQAWYYSHCMINMCGSIVGL